jgi:hypothetical protein
VTKLKKRLLSILIATAFIGILAAFFAPKVQPADVKHAPVQDATCDSTEFRESMRCGWQLWLAHTIVIDGDASKKLTDFPVRTLFTCSSRGVENELLVCRTRKRSPEKSGLPLYLTSNPFATTEAEMVRIMPFTSESVSVRSNDWKTRWNA